MSLLMLFLFCFITIFLNFIGEKRKKGNSCLNVVAVIRLRSFEVCLSKSETAA